MFSDYVFALYKQQVDEEVQTVLALTRAEEIIDALRHWHQSKLKCRGDI